MRPTVLCVDDDRNLCEILAKALRGEGYAVQLAHDGEDALAAIHLHQPDLLLIDVMLPRRDGFEVLEAVRAAGGPLAEVPAVLLSGCSRTPTYVERAARLRAVDLLTKPVPLDALLGLVAKQLPGAPGAAEAADSCGAAGTQEPAVAGKLEEMPLPALLHHLHGMRASGVLHLRAGRKRKRIELAEGRPVAVRSNLIRECLGNLLVRTGRITEAQLQESVRRMKQGEGLQGEVLVAMQLVAEDELGDVLRQQAEEKLYEAFEWTRGTYELQRGTRLARANALPLDRSPADVILSGIRGRFPIARIDAFLSANAERQVRPGESPFYRFQDIALEPAEAELLNSCSDPVAVTSLLTECESVRRAAYGLLVAGLLELVDAGGSPAATTAGAAAATAAPSPAIPSAEVPLRTELVELLRRFQGASHFAVLGVSEAADDEEVRRAYAELARRTHPDRFGNASAAVKALAEEAFARVAAAHEALADARRRAEYRLDQRRAEREAAELEEGHRALRAELEFQKGERLLRARDARGALECFTWAVELYPEEGEYHAYHGWAHYLASGRREEALREALRRVRRGAKLAPDREKTYLFLGRLYRAAGRMDLARRAFARAVQLRPDCVEALRELRLIRMRQRSGRRGLVGWLRERAGLVEARGWPRRIRPG